MAGPAAVRNTSSHGNTNSHANPSQQQQVHHPHAPQNGHPIDEMVHQLQLASFMPGREAVKALLPSLRATPSHILTGLMSETRDPLDVLDPAQCTLGYLHILQARLHHIEHGAEIPHLITHMTRFAEFFSLDQLPPGQAGAMLNSLVSTLMKLQPKSAPNNAPNVHAFFTSCLMSLRMITYKLSSAWMQLTFVGVHFLKACLLTCHYKYAWDMVAQDISEIEPKEYDIKIQDFLLHHYYGAMICIGLKRFDRALEMLSLCISAPATVTSAIQIEAYRKLMLVSYIQHGKVLPFPKYTAQAVVRASKSYSAAYHDFVAALESNNYQRVTAELNKQADAFNKHNNVGLAKQALNAWTRKAIAQLTQTYLTLALSDIARLVGIGEGPRAAQEAEHHLLCMIDEGGIHATISYTAGGMVSFHDQIDAFDDVDTTAKLDLAIRQANEATSQVSKMDRLVGASKEYLNKIVHGDRPSAAASGGIPTSSSSAGRMDSSGLGGGGLVDDDFFDDMTC
ncbi:hypothetical protein SeMB42_g01885 [Synchytrium endobioticum]|uniref:COP9 signalosome complex subunit 3 n=1 Tax=Synchytrium endobioticum TaxID=286115 RepID=A0A507DIN2_9FUNG|nr:hypothetical protein SeLEV6574_g05983 [Synchytrium endobioticum]TPX51522.1 hypothetical protein SeMB42_g01885 [Synchytrium endobioticum]